MPSSPKVIGVKKPEITYTRRFATRVVARNKSEQIAIIYVQKGNYFKLPGGGIEGDEDRAEAAKREAQEETGATVVLRAEEYVATTEEFRNDLHQVSYCYVADVVDDTGTPSLTAEEIGDGLSHRWVDPNKALKDMENVKPTSELGKYIQERYLSPHRGHESVLDQDSPGDHLVLGGG
ncbi:NUDIX hydrolase domain-like protein [Xylariomycetidae sp. FL2044]|nr:NUDIX hydrolase domain-like protein [Xylariomycetidae sp. FL2044]